MKSKHTALLLSILVFISTLFWPQLLDKQQLLIFSCISVLILLVPKLRILAVIPITAVYITVYTSITLTGQPYASAQIVNKSSLATFVDGHDHNIVVQIVSLISSNNQGYFNAKLIELDDDHLNYSPLIKMRWYKPNVVLQAGQLHRFEVSFKPVYGRANPGGFDRQKWFYSEHIAYQATIKKHLLKVNISKSLRASFYEKVQKTTKDLTHQGLLLALSFADKSLISFEKKQHIRNIGISHLFAISGLHIGLLFSFTYILARCIYTRLLPVRYMGWTSLRLINITALFVGAWFYAYLAGFSLPTQRAFLMLFITVLIFSLKRKCSKTDLLLLVFFIVLIVDPLAILSLSLWLSFIAVAIIVSLLWLNPTRAIIKTEQQTSSVIKTVITYFKRLLYLQLGLTALMLPVQLVSFSGISWTTILVNLIAIPLFSLLIIPLVLVASLTTLIYQPLAFFLFQSSDLLITYFFKMTAFAKGSYQFFSVSDGRIVIVVCFMCAGLFIIHFHNKSQRQLSYLFSFVLACLLSLTLFKQDKSWFVEVIDVGQGLSVLVRTQERALLYDTGASYPSGFNMVDSEISPYLITLGIKQLDYLVISHSDNDHAGGADHITQTVAISERWAGEPLNSIHPFKQCKAGQNWQLGMLTVEVLSPQRVGKNNNNNSCVLFVSDGNTSLLLTGDIDKKQERKLLNSYADKINSTVLIVPHHGSRYSSSEAFIEGVNPQWAVFSAGFMNQWHFPAQEVLERYEKYAIKTANSGLSGFIRFQITPQAINMETFREDIAPYWYHHSFLP